MKVTVKILVILMLLGGFAFTACGGSSGEGAGDPSLLPSTIVFADGAAVSKQLGTGPYTNTVTGDGTGAITYSSGTTATATIDESTGAVTLVALGSTVITAVKASTATHETVTNTYTLTVTALTPSTIEFGDGLNITKLIGSGNYTNTVTAGNGTGAITYTSSIPETATVNQSTGEVTLVAAGTTVITATKAASGIYDIGTKAYTLTVIKNPSTIVFTDGAAVAKQLGSGTYINTVSGDGTGAVTYTSGTTDTATIGETTGIVTLVAVGTTVITAVKAATATNGTVTNTYTLTVTTLTPSTIVFTTETAVSRQLGSGTYTNTILGGVGTGAITYNSGTPATATVDASTGEVTLLAAGTTVITATKAASGIYDTGTNSYTLTVTALTPSTIVFTTETAVSRQLGSGSYTNTILGGVGTGAVTYNSGTPATATVNASTGAVTLVAAGTTVITATKVASGVYDIGTNSYTLTVTKIPSTIVFANGTTVSKQIGSGTYTNTVTGVGNGSITYTSGTPETATVNLSTGEVTLVAVGSTVITVVKAATSTYTTVTNTYILTVRLEFVVGDKGPSGVGVVFYITDGGLHGLEAAPSLWNGGTADPGATWKTTNTSTAGTLTAIGTGYANTHTYMLGAEHPAAALCRAYGGGGKTDWFLPSKDELNQLFLNRTIVGGFFGDYWSSSENDNSSACNQLFIDGNQGTGPKTNFSKVRAVRAF